MVRTLPGRYGKDLGAPGQATIDGSAFEHFVGGATARSPAAQRAWRHSALTKIVRALIGQNAWTVDSGMEGGTIYQDARADQGSKYSRIGWHTDLQVRACAVMGATETLVLMLM